MGQVEAMHESNQQKKNMANINQALGLFLFVFAVIVLFSILFTETGVGKLTNLICGSILALIGGGMVYAARQKLKSLD